jgi:uncharacterized membrane protein
MVKFFRRHFLTGLLVLMPTVLTGYIVWKIFESIDNLIAPIQRRFPILDFPGTGFFIVIVLIFVTGFLASNLIGRRLIDLGERVLNRLPLIRRIYTAVKELSEVFLTDRKTVFKRVVLIRYPHPGTYALAFVTRDVVGYFNAVVGQDVVNVFVPTTPNPTSGFLLLIPKSDAVAVDISVEEAMKIVISGGAFSPSFLESLIPQNTG